MKARVYLLVVVFAASLVTAWAQEAKTNAVPAAGEAVAPPVTAAPATSAPAAVKEAKPSAVGTSTPASSIPGQPKIATTPRMSTSEGTGTGHKEILTNPPPPAVPATEGVKPSDDLSMTPTSAAPVEAEVTPASPPEPAAPPPEGAGLDRKTALLIGGAIVLVAGGLAFWMWRRANIVSHGSLISSALNLVKYDEKTEDRTEDKNEEKPGEKSEAGTEVIGKPEEKKFPPPMN